SIEINNNIKETILDHKFWVDLKKLHDFLELFIVFIRQLESNKPYLSSTYKTLQDLKNSIMNNSQILEKLPDIINSEVIRIAGTDNKDKTLSKLTEYLRKLGVALKILSILATSAASECNWSAYGFIHSKLRNRMLTEKAEKLVFIYWNIRILHQLKRSILVRDIHVAEKTCSVTLNNQEQSGDLDNNDINEDNFTNFSNRLLNMLNDS
ncbi:9360_t:CDS:2, partial [Scutellospora calospora]